MVVSENLTIANKILEDTRANFEGEKKQKEELLLKQKSREISVSGKIIRFENESRSKDSEILELKHEIEKLKTLKRDSEKQ